MKTAQEVCEYIRKNQGFFGLRHRSTRAWHGPRSARRQAERVLRSGDRRAHERAPCHAEVGPAAPVSGPVAVLSVPHLKAEGEAISGLTIILADEARALRLALEEFEGAFE